MIIVWEGKLIRGQGVNMKQQSKYVRVLKRIIDPINSLSRGMRVSLPRMLWGLFVMLASLVVGVVVAFYMTLMTSGNADPAHLGLRSLFVVLVLFFGPIYFFISVLVRSTFPPARFRGKLLVYMFVHGAYVLCMIVSIIQLLPNLISANKVTTSPYVCLLLLLLVEATACFFYGRDFFRGLERLRLSRWWIRTTPYPVIGFIFLLFFNLWNEGVFGEADFSLFFSVAVSVLAVNYLVQIINERIVPREGPYRKTYMAVYNRPVHARPACHRPFPRRAHARRPKAGRGEGAC